MKPLNFLSFLSLIASVGLCLNADRIDFKLEETRSKDYYEGEDSQRSWALKASVDSSNTASELMHCPRYDESHQILMGPAAIVDGCVNAITGSFFDVEIDLEIPGTPLNLTRSYCSGSGALKPSSSGDYKNECHDLFRCWGWNHATIFYRRPHWHILNVGNIQNGSKDIFDLDERTFKGKIHKNLFKGWTNASYGVLSGQTDMHNQKVDFSELNRDNWCVTLEDGTERHFGSHKVSYGKKEQQYWFCHEDRRCFPDGLEMHYQHSGPFQFSRVEIKDRLGDSTTGFIEKKESTLFTDSLGRTVRYYLKDFEGSYDGVPVKVERSNKLTLEYEYIQFLWSGYISARAPGQDPKNTYIVKNTKYVPLISRKSFPNDRYFNINYIDGYPKYWTHKGYIKGTPLHKNAGKVSELLAPLGESVQGVVKYKFDYLDDKTIVKNACGDIQEFCFDKENRLTAVVSKNGQGSELERHYRWGKGAKEGYLDRQWACDNKGNALYCKRFEYDSFGNVTAEFMYGDFTGRGNQVKLDANGEIKNTAEMTTTSYEYSNDKFHLMTKEIHRDGKEIRYVYEEGSSRLIAKFESLNGQIVHRTFQSYDKFSNVSLLVEDDGTSTDIANLENVYVRKICRREAYESGVEIGLIQKEVLSYFDTLLQKEYELSRSEFVYNEARVLKERTTWIAGQKDPIWQSYEYDRCLNVISETLPTGGVITRAYDANNNKILERGPDNRVEVSFAYDYMNRLISKTEKHPDGEFTTRYRYDLMGKLIEDISPYDLSRKYSYDSLGRAVEQQTQSAFDQEGEAKTCWAKESFAYDSFGRVIQKTDALGYVEKFNYNCLGQLLFEQKQGKPSVRHEYNLEGLKIATYMGTGSKELYEYDGLGRQTSLKRFDENGNEVFSQNFEYLGMKLSKASDSMGRMELMIYDGAGRLKEKEVRDLVEDVCQKETWTYDGASRATVHRQYANESDFIENSYLYTVTGKVAEKTTHTASGVCLASEIYEYDLSDRLVKETKLTNGSAQSQVYEYDSHGKITRVIDLMGAIWVYENSYATTAAGSLAKVDIVKEHRPDGTLKTEWKTPDSLPLKTAIYAANGTLAYEADFGYDAYKGCTYRRESVIESVGEVGEVITKVVFGPSRQVLKRMDACGSSHERIRKWGYDDIGLLSWHEKPSGLKLTYSYDSFGLLHQVVSSDGTVYQTLEHDAYGRLIKSIEANGSSISRSYNALGQLIQEDLGDGLIISKTYDGLGRVLETTLPYGVVTTRAYEDSLLRSIEMKGSLGCYSHQYLEYDDQGRIIHERLAGNVSDLHRNYDAMGRGTYIKSDFFESSVYSFDVMGRVLDLEKGFSNLNRIHFTYDALGQLLSEERDGVRTSYEHNSSYQRLKKNDKQYENNDLGELLSVTDSTKQQFTHDLDGRLIHYQAGDLYYDMSYDALDHLIRVKSSTGDCFEYTYDGLDRRLTKKIISNNEVTQENYVFDEFFEVGSCLDNTWKDFRLIGTRSQAETGDTLVAVIDQRAYACILDLQGSLVGWVDLETGNLSSECEYDAFGVCSGERLGPWGYVCKRVDSETNWIFFGKRYYIPDHGRWLTRDPKGEIDGSNLYAFLRNNPVYKWDLWGLSAELGAHRPTLINTSELRNDSREVLRIRCELEATFDMFHRIYGHKKYNAEVISVFTSSDAPWIVGINGIRNSRKDAVNSALKLSRETGTNVMWVYDPSRGFSKDVQRVRDQNVKQKYEETHVPEMYMRSAELGLKLNQEKGIDRLIGLSHSQGGTQMLRAGKEISDVNLFEKMYFYAMGTPADARIAAARMQWKAITDEKDEIARSGARPNSDSHVIYVNNSPSYNWYDVDGYLKAHSFEGPSYWDEVLDIVSRGYNQNVPKYF